MSDGPSDGRSDPRSDHGAGGGARDGRAPGGTLFVVATPIGNLGDVTLRALEALRSVPLIAAEDTRVTRRLLARYEIPTRTVSFHARSSPARQAELLAHLAAGADLALVTDAGTPLVSDPGEGLVATWAAAGGPVVAIPGASSVMAAVAVSGLAGPRWSFEGFLPRRGRDRRDRLARISADDRGSVLFEAPTRLAGTLHDLVAACGGDRPGAVCRELTKLHEQVVRGPLAGLEARVADGSIPLRGEVVVVVGWRDAREGVRSGAEIGEARDDDRARAVGAARAEVDRLVAVGTARGEAARRIAAATGLPRRALYGAPAARAAEGPGDRGPGA